MKQWPMPLRMTMKMWSMIIVWLFFSTVRTAKYLCLLCPIVYLLHRRRLCRDLELESPLSNATGNWDPLKNHRNPRIDVIVMHWHFCYTSINLFCLFEKLFFVVFSKIHHVVYNHKVYIFSRQFKKFSNFSPHWENQSGVLCCLHAVLSVCCVAFFERGALRMMRCVCFNVCVELCCAVFTLSWVVLYVYTFALCMYTCMSTSICESIFLSLCLPFFLCWLLSNS